MRLPARTRLDSFRVPARAAGALLVLAGLAVPLPAAPPPQGGRGPSAVLIEEAAVEPGAISPNMDGVQDVAVLEVLLDTRNIKGLMGAGRSRRPPADVKTFLIRWSWTLRSPSGPVVRILEGEEALAPPFSLVRRRGPRGRGRVPYVRGGVQASWDGTDGQGMVVPDGEYSWTVEAEVVRVDDLGHGGTREVSLGEAEPVPGTLFVDGTPPVIDLAWPPDEIFGTDLSTVQVQGTATDAGSGIGQVTLQDGMGTVDLGHPAFDVTRSLDTAIPPGGPAAFNPITITARDLAGNEAVLGLNVMHTMEASVAEVDSSRTELVDGIVTSVNQSMVIFQPGVTRAQIRSLASLAGGRVAGFLPTINAAQIIFGTGTVAELETALDHLGSSADVVSTSPSVMWETDSHLDNDALPSASQANYVDVNSPAATHAVNASGLPVAPVSVAVIDSGLAPGYGTMNEMAGVNMVDLCTLVGRFGIFTANTDAPGFLSHGATVASVIAGANNGQGNNGILAGITGLAPQVNLFAAADCDCRTQGSSDCQVGGNGLPVLDGNTLLLATELVASAHLGINYAAVNMSFGGTVPNSQDFDDRTRFYDEYFRARRDILWVMSAGNGSATIGCNNVSPGSLSCAHQNAMTATSHNTGTLTTSGFSNTGAGATLSAPGNLVWLALAGTYGPQSGTSYSAPMVTAAGALLMGLEGLLPQQVKSELILTGRVLNSAALPRGLDMLAAVQASIARITGMPPPGTTRAETICRIPQCPANSDFCSPGLISGGETVTLPSGVWGGMTPGLAGFRFDYADDDHHLEQIRAIQLSQQLDVAFNDDNDDDLFEYCVTGRSLPSGTTYGTVQGTSGGGAADIAINAGSGVPVITGFELEFLNGDHHVDVIEVSVTASNVHVELNDQNNDDPFAFAVDFAVIPAAEVASTGTLSGTGPQGQGASAVSFSALRPLLQSFRVDYTPGGTDHHVDEVGVQLGPGLATIWLNDKNDDDSFSWSLRWVDLLN